MRHVDSEIWLALKSRIDALTTSPTLPVFDPGEAIDPPSDAVGPLPFVLASDVRNDPARIGIDPRMHTRSGTLILSIQWPISRAVTHLQLMQLGGSIASHFPADLRMKTGATCLRVTQDSASMQPNRDGAYHVVIVRIFWSTT